MSKKTFLRGAAILGIAGLLVQVLGAVFRIPLGNIIGDQGMGYYQTAYPIYIFLLVFSTNGAPAAISKMTSERLALGRADEAHRVFKLSFILMGILGVVAFSAVFFGAEAIVTMAQNKGAYYALLAIAPALLFVPLMSVYRGYFQGMQNMAPTAVSQMVEQAVRVAVGLTLAVVLLPKGLQVSAAGATAGASIGPIFGILVLWYLYSKNKGEIYTSVDQANEGEREGSLSIIKTLAWIAVPITIGVSIMPIINLGDLIFVMTRLQDIGYSEFEANALYGQMTGMALPVVNIPMALALSMALSMVPAIASAKSTGDVGFLNMNVQLGLRTSMIIGIPCSFGLIALAEPIMSLLYPLQRESAVNAANCLLIVSIGIVFLCVAQTMAGVLQGIGKISMAVYGIIIGFVVKLAATYFLIGFPHLNILGAAWGTVIAFVAIGMFNLIAVKKATGIKFNLKQSLWTPLISGLSMFAAVIVVYKVLNMITGNTVATLVGILVGVLVYAVVLLRSGGLTAREIEMLPRGAKLAAILRKLKLVS